MSETVQAGKVVDLGYVLKNSKGETLDQTAPQEPFSYLHGTQQIVPGLENALVGLKTGDKKKVTVTPEEGYGDLDPELKMKVKRAQFPAGVDVKLGMQFETQTADGHGIVFTVEGINGDEISIDGNHPLAGETLHFDVEVFKIRDATDEEMEHGHAHGAHGHGHDHDHGDHDHDHDHGDHDGHDHD